MRCYSNRPAAPPGSYCPLRDALLVSAQSETLPASPLMLVVERKQGRAAGALAVWMLVRGA